VDRRIQKEKREGKRRKGRTKEIRRRMEKS